MPGLIRLQPQEQIPGQIPYGHADPAAFALPATALYQGTGQLQQSSLQALQAFESVQTALGKEDRKLNLIETLSALKDEYAARDVETRSRVGESPDPATGARNGLDPSQYHPAMQQTAQQLLQKYERHLRYPDTAAAFREQALPFLTEQGIKARYEGLKLQGALLETRDGMLIDQLVNKAVTAPQEADQRAAFSQVLDIVRSGVESGRYSGEQGAAKIKGILTSVDRGTAMRDFRNPDLRASVIDRLVTGRFSQRMSAEEQFNLAHTMQSQFDTEQRQRDAKVEADTKKMQQTVVSDLFARARRKEVTPAEIESQRVQWNLNREDVSAITTALEKPPVEAPSDPATFQRVSGDVHSMSPKISEREINRLYAAHWLNTKDRNDLMEKRTARVTHLVEYGHSLQMQQQGQAEQRGKTELGIPDILPPGLDPVREQAWAAYIRELTARSNAFPGGTESPLTVADEIIPRYKRLIEGQANLDYTKTDKLATYKTMEALQAARPGMSEGQYRIERDYTQRLIDLQKENLQRSIDAVLKAGQGGGGTTPKKSGGTSKSTALPAVK